MRLALEFLSRFTLGRRGCWPRNLRQPITTPALPPGNSSPPPLPVQGNEREGNVLPGAPATPPAMPTIESYPAERMRLDDLIVESRGIGEPGSAERKAATWDHYQKRGGDWTYERWSMTYEQNQVRALQANAAVSEYHNTQGWGEREVTVYPVVNGVESPRRLDIADEAARRGVEYKTGYQTASADNLWELQRDAELVASRGWSIEWVFRDRASQPLLDALDRAGIKYKIEP